MTTDVMGSRMWNPVKPEDRQQPDQHLSEPYADEEMQSLDSTPSAAFFDSRSSCRDAVTRGCRAACA